MRVALFTFTILGAVACTPVDEVPVAADPVTCSAGDLFENALNLGNTAATFELVVFVDDDGERELQFADGSFIRYAMNDQDPPLVVGPGLVDVRAGTKACFGEGCDFGVHELGNVNDGRFLIFGELNALDGSDDSRGAPSGSPVAMEVPPAAATCAVGGTTPAVLIVDTDDGAVSLSPTQSTRVTIEGEQWFAAAGTARRTEFLQNDEPCADCPSSGLHEQTSIELLLYRLP